MPNPPLTPTSPLSARRVEFTRRLGRLLAWAEAEGLRVALNEVLRSPAQAEANAAAGRGISNSLHLSGLAADLLLYSPEGAYLTQGEGYARLGEAWEALGTPTLPNAWGGRFTKPDPGHFSLPARGVK